MFDLRIILHTDTHADPGSLGQYTVNAITEALGALVSSWLSTHHFKTGSDRNVLRRRGRSNQTKERELSRGIRRHGLSSPLPSLGLKRSFTDDVMTTPSTTSWERDDSQGRPRPAPILNGDSEDERQNEEMLDCPRATRRHTSNLPIHPRPSGASTTSGRISLKTSSTPKKSTPWLDNVLENWKNPVFRSAEEPIPCVNVELSTQEPTRLEVSLFSDVACAAKSHLTNSTLPGKTKLTKEALRLGKVVAQVDSQFILLLVASDPLDAHNLDMLVMVDQHAADERCRVERLFHELCEPAEAGGAVSNLGVRSSIRSTSLPKTISFKLPVQEARHFCAQAGHFAKWGIIYDLETSPDDSTTETLTIKALPTPISQRAAADPPLLISLLRAEMWKVAEHGRGGSSAHPSHDERELHPVNSHGWTRSMAGCPAGIVDMLNSRACRSAVMFNDPLTLDESAAMIARLAACAFPFQCAHGRPSVVPLLRLAEAAPKGGAEGPVEFVEAFRKWKDSEAEERSHDFTT
jgi:DNA mismatch repair ATPase MutL